MRKKVVAGNWKMNMDLNEAKNLVNVLLPKIKDNKEVDKVFAVPYTDISVVADMVKGTDIKVAAENFYFEDKGAFTGEISANMIKSSGASMVILGHSERRTIFKEDDEMINKKVLKALSENLTPILCVGESLEEREKNITIEKIKSQIESDFKDVTKEDAVKVIIAYEPIWAIGTGKTATSDQAEEVCKSIRDMIKNMYGDDVASSIRILYGGSVNSKNAKELFMKENIDGGLVGGASLKEEFIDIVNY